jgi:8-oxo-dGTP diphosphatase
VAKWFAEALRVDLIETMASQREYPERPVVGVGGVIIDDDRVVLIRRGSEPLRGQWSIPGGVLELGETLEAGVRRELLEETGIHVRIVEMIEVFDRIIKDGESEAWVETPKTRFHFVIVDYLGIRVSGEPMAGSDVTELAFARESELEQYGLTETATRIVRKAFEMHRARRQRR